MGISHTRTAQIGAVYAIRAVGTDFVKIGRVTPPKPTHNHIFMATLGVQSRLECLQTGCPFKLVRERLLCISTREEAIDVERKLHELLSDRRVRGEWFKISISDLEDVATNLDLVMKR